MQHRPFIYIHWSAFGNLIRRYATCLRDAWALRDQLTTSTHPHDELSFLPAHLEIIESPSHPVAQWMMRIIIAGVGLVLSVSVFGQLDVVVVCNGRLIPNARVKVVQSALTGVVQQIFVQDGQRVTPGQPLLRLDATQAEADEHKAFTEKIEAAMAASRAEALLTAQKMGASPVLSPVPGAPADKQDQALRFAEGIYEEYVAKLASARAELLKREAAFRASMSEIDKLRATTPLVRRQADDYKLLTANSTVSQHEYLEKERKALEQEHELAAQQNHAKELAAGVAEQRAAVQLIISQFRREQLDVSENAIQKFENSRDDEIKAETRKRLLSLNAPVGGTVQQLAVHTIGGVVTSAQSIMEIVPDDEVEAEVHIDNKDIGFISSGQDVVVKVAAFPYTRFGYVAGKVILVSNDAVREKERKRGSPFIARVRLSKTRMFVDKKWVNLTPGMEVVAEIKTGERNLASYFFDPLIQGAQESLRER